MKTDKFCIFCGRRPESKTKEHVLPRWLLELTGSPKRVVPFGFNYLTLEQRRFDWDSFAFPACASCNQQHSVLEDRAKEIVEHLLQGTPVTSRHYVILLDWLDKVRIGLRLGYFYLHRNPMRVSPRYYVESRIGQKDRMLAIYTINTDNKGLNAVGAETPSFQLSPTCFSLNINCIHILNMSWDYMCSARCGFPFPRKMVTDLDGQRMIECSDYIATHKIKHPILRRRIIKPSIHIYQPILQRPLDGQDEWVKSMLIPGSEHQGLLIRQYDSHTEVIKSLDSLLEYNEVIGHDCKPLRDIMAQTYDFQLTARPDIQYRSADPVRLSNLYKNLRSVEKLTEKYRDTIKNLKEWKPTK